MSAKVPVVVLGAGPAGLGLAWKLACRGGFEVTVLERNSEPGGNAGSFEWQGQRLDYGSHRLHPSCAPGILADIRGFLGSDLLDRPRHGRIRLLGRWLHFPLKPFDLALHAPPSFLTGVLLDKMRPRPTEGAATFATLLEQGLGQTICREFYFPYARKIWGLAPEELDAEQARRRVSASSLGKIVRKVMSAVPGLKPPGAGRFFYPRRGYGQISDGYLRAAAGQGVRVFFETQADGIEREGSRVVALRAGGERLPASLVLSTIPVTALARLLDPPSAVLAAAGALRYRAMILIYLALEADQFTGFDAHYFPGGEIAITRLSEPKHYGLAGEAGRTVLCAELPCSTGDACWSATDEDLGALVVECLGRAGLPLRPRVGGIVTRRLPQAYPVYATGFRADFDRIDDWLAGLEGLLTLGRQGLFVHDNTHHTLAMAYAAAASVRDDGSLDREQWATARSAFESNVVED
ncbi:MAG: FAD-dependent oxidoreductase [Bryobacteraceae bacterium]